MFKKILAVIIVTTLVISSCLFIARGYADGGQIYLTPSSLSQLNGSLFSLALRINPTVAVSAVQAYVSYDSSLMQYNSMTLGPFNVCAQQSGGGGTVSIACGLPGNSTVSSDTLIANISFTAIAGSSSSSLALNNAKAVSNNAYVYPSTSGASVSFTSPTPTPTPTPSSSGSNTTSTKHTSSVTSNPNTTSNTSTSTSNQNPTTSTSSPTVKIINIADKSNYKSAKITLKSSVPIQAYIIYGTSSKDISLQTPLSPSSNAPVISIGNANLIPGTKYYYQVVSEINGSVVSKSPVKEFMTKGYTIKIAVLDNYYKPLINKVVILHSTPIAIKTDKNGIATFTNVTPGEHHLTYINGDKTYSAFVYAQDNVSVNKFGLESAPDQTTAAVLNGFITNNSSTNKSIYSIIFIILLSAIAVIGYLLLKMYLKQSHKKLPNLLKLRHA